MDPDMAKVQAQIANLQSLRSRGALPPDLEKIYQKAVQAGLIPPDQGPGGPPIPQTGPAAPDPRTMVAYSLRGGGITQPGSPAYNQAYGGTINPPGDAPMRSASPQDLMMHYAEQLALEKAGQPIGGASGGARVIRPTDTEVRPWAGKEAGGAGGGFPSSASDLYSVKKQPRAPSTYGSGSKYDVENTKRQREAEILQMLLGR